MRPETRLHEIIALLPFYGGCPAATTHAVQTPQPAFISIQLYFWDWYYRTFSVELEDGAWKFDPGKQPPPEPDTFVMPSRVKLEEVSRFQNTGELLEYLRGVARTEALMYDLWRQGLVP